MSAPVSNRNWADEVVPLLSQLVSIDSAVGTSGGAAQHVIGNYLASTGYNVVYSVDDASAYARHPEYIQPPCGEPAVNLLAMPRGQRSGLVFFAHIDTEGRSPRDERDSPTTAGRLYGTGTADDKSGVAAAAVAAAALAAAGERAPIVLSVHGKGGGARGTLPAFTRAPALAGAVYVHPPETGLGLQQIKHASRGVLDLRLTVRGWEGSPGEIGTPESASFADAGDALRAALALIDRFRRSSFAGCEVNVGRLAAGERAGVAPLACEADIRVLFDAPRRVAPLVAAARADIAACKRDLARGSRGFGMEIAPTRLRANPAFTDWNARLCRAVRTAVTRVTRIEPAPYAGHLASDIRFPVLLRQCPAVGIGCLAGGFYGPDEWVDVDDLKRLVRVLIAAGRAWNELEEP
jgi:acetylornithine deacetylase